MSEAAEPAAGSEGRSGAAPTAWIAIFALVFAGLVLSIVNLISADYLPARFVDVEQSHLTRTPAGTRLTLVLRHAPRHGQLHTEVVPPEGDEPCIVKVQLSAVGAPAPKVDEDDRRTLLIDLPPTDRVRVVDLRWGREEAVEIGIDVPLAP